MLHDYEYNVPRTVPGKKWFCARTTRGISAIPEASLFFFFYY